MNKEIINTNSDELSFEGIFNFVKILYKKKFLLLSFLTATLIISGLYYITPSNKKEVSINLNPVSDSYIVQFRNYNQFNTDGFVVPVEVSSIKLMEDFYNEFKNSNELNNFVEKKYNLQSFSGTVLEKNILIEQLSQNYFIKKIFDKNNPELFFLNFSFASQNVTSDLELIMKLINNLELNVLEKYKNIILQTEFVMNEFYNNTLRTLEENISTSLDKQDLEIVSYLGFLEEQAKIARVLNIDIPTPEQTQSANQLQSLGIIGSNMEDDNYARYPYYFRGYVAIEEEMNLIKNRENKEIFFQDHADNIIELQINSEKRAIRDLKLISSMTPFFNGRFQAIEYDFNKILISEPSTKKIIALLILIAGFMSSLFIIYTLEKYSEYKTNLSN